MAPAKFDGKSRPFLSAGLVLTLANIGLLYGLHIMLGRILPLQVYGDIAVAFAAARISAVAGSLGFPQFFLKEFPVLSRQGDWRYSSGLINQ